MPNHDFVCLARFTCQINRDSKTRDCCFRGWTWNRTLCVFMRISSHGHCIYALCSTKPVLLVVLVPQIVSLKYVSTALGAHKSVSFVYSMIPSAVVLTLIVARTSRFNDIPDIRWTCAGYTQREEITVSTTYTARPKDQRVFTNPAEYIFNHQRRTALRATRISLATKNEEGQGSSRDSCYW